MTEFLLLDFKRPQETINCVRSINHFADFDYKIRLLHNGPAEEYHGDLISSGEIDYLHCNDDNLGCGVGTIQLFAMCETDYAIYVQVDQFLGKTLTTSAIEGFQSVIEKEDNIAYIDLAGNQGHGNFSERAAFINTDWYNNIPKSCGGPGPLAHIKWTEECVQDYMKEKDLSFFSLLYFADNGKYSYRTNPDGSEWLHETDTKKLKLIKGPIKEKYVYPKFTDEEWEKVLETQEWEDGKIPEKEVAHSFVAWKDE